MARIDSVLLVVLSEGMANLIVHGFYEVTHGHNTVSVDGLIFVLAMWVLISSTTLILKICT